MQNQQFAHAEIAALHAAAVQAARAGDEDTAGRAWGRILALDAHDELALTSVGKRAFKQGDLAGARDAFTRLVQAHPQVVQGWLSLALVGQRSGDEDLEESSLTGALRADPGDLLALILRANMFERQGQRHKAASTYGAVASVAPPLEQLNPDLRASVRHAWEYRHHYNGDFGAFIDRFLEGSYQERDGADLRRFREAVDIMLERKRRYDSQSMMFHYPGLLPQPFFDRADFPWLDALEAGTDAIRAELLQVLAREQDIVPYMNIADDHPHNQFAELNKSPRWSAFHLMADGKPVAGNAEQCPQTMALLGGAPQPDQPGRTPTAMISLLKPKTRIPAHVGVSNVRLVTHLPLIVPPGCGFRVGNETRSWEPGKAFVFDDTIEHEAWNDSHQLRVVLIFDIWHPQLSVAERAMITALTAGINEFRGGGGFAL
ncbi:MAG: aspartyl/asparaginyl beta-hydroxylase domain-containing protein [Massilia sp.]